MSNSSDLDSSVVTSRAKLLAEMVHHGHYIPSGLPGVYGRGGAFEGVIECFEAAITDLGDDQNAEVMRFPPVLGRSTYLRTDHLESMPHLLGAVGSFTGDEAAHAELMRRARSGESWGDSVSPTDMVMVPAACYPLYPTARGSLPLAGRVVDLRTWVFRREPSDDPARLQIFRQREYVRLGSPQQALAHRDLWIRRGLELYESLALPVRKEVASDPFFGRGGRVMKATQREQHLKYELVVPITSEERPTAITSSNYHLDHFGSAFGINTADGSIAHTSCVGFGLERIALALFRHHGMRADSWPSEIRGILGL